uniref:VWFA domain-containing protein n=1 Tax=Parastrongyloides trichosuri TaxID=131310 RepID=A0A0N4Z0Q2_PARTI
MIVLLFLLLTTSTATVVKIFDSEKIILDAPCTNYYGLFFIDNSQTGHSNLNTDIAIVDNFFDYSSSLRYTSSVTVTSQSISSVTNNFAVVSPNDFASLNMQINQVLSQQSSGSSVSFLNLAIQALQLDFTVSSQYSQNPIIIIIISSQVEDITNTAAVLSNLKTKSANTVKVLAIVMDQQYTSIASELVGGPQYVYAFNMNDQNKFVNTNNWILQQGCGSKNVPTISTTSVPTTQLCNAYVNIVIDATSDGQTSDQYRKQVNLVENYILTMWSDFSKLSTMIMYNETAIAYKAYNTYETIGDIKNFIGEYGQSTSQSTLLYGATYILDTQPPFTTYKNVMSTFVFLANINTMELLQAEGYARDLSASGRLSFITMGSNINSNTLSSLNPTNPIDVLDHITFINVPILTVNVTGYVSNLRGFDMVLSKHNKTYLNQYYGINIENKSFFTKDRLSNCGLLYCNVGLYLLHDTVYPIDIVKRKITDFKGAFYLKFMTNEMELIFNKFYIYGERYPLIICPYKRWVSIYSGVVFQPYDENGIVNENFYDTYIILPAYQRKINLTRFVCGDIIYADKTKLRIIYKFAKIDYHYTQIFLTSTISENLVCSENDKPSMYYHFAYNKDDRNMRYIGKNETRYEPIYYGELIYMYNKNNEKLKILQEEMSIVDRNTTITIEPKCINRLGNLPGTLNLYVDEKLVKFDKLSQIKRTGYLYITNEMLNKVYNIKCKIDIEQIDKSSTVSVYGSITNEHYDKIKKIDVLRHIIFINIKILTINISTIPPSLYGFFIKSYNNDKSIEKQYFVQNFKNDVYFHKENYSSCQLFHCEVGLYLLHNGTDAKKIEDDRITNFYGVFYIKLVTSDMMFVFHKFTIKGNKFPLIVCPYIRWVLDKAGLIFKPYEKSGIVYKNFYDRYIILPAYQRDINSPYFICGDIIYVDETKLRIIYKFIISNDEYMKIGVINLKNNVLVCNFNDKPSMYHHFVYDKYEKNMRYIMSNKINNELLYYGEIIYMYQADSKELNRLQKENAITDGKIFNQIDPTCAYELGSLPGTVNLYINNKLVKFNNTFNKSVNRNGIMYITPDMLNTQYHFECRIDLNDANKYPSITKYYNKTVKISFVKYDYDGNRETINNLTFRKNHFTNYAEYKCLIEKKREQDTNELISNVNNLTVLFLPQLDNNKEKWKTFNDVLIVCQRKFLDVGYLKNIKVYIDGNEFYELKMNKSLFKITESSIQFMHEKVRDISKKLKEAQTICYYKSTVGIEFKIVKDGKVLQEVIATKSANTNHNQNVLLTIEIIIFGIMLLILTLLILMLKKKHKKIKCERCELSSSITYSHS